MKKLRSCGQSHADIGSQAYEARFNQRRLKFYTKALDDMGYNVQTLETDQVAIAW